MKSLRLAERMFDDAKVSRILNILTHSTGLTVALDKTVQDHGGNDRRCGKVRQNGKEAMSACSERRRKLVDLAVTPGDSHVIRCPVGKFCLVTPIHVTGERIAILRACGFTRPASKSFVEAIKGLIEMASSEIVHRIECLLTHEPPNRVIRRAVEFIQSRFREDISVDQIARHTGVSRQHLVKLWKRNQSVPIMAYVNFLRIEHSKSLLKLRNHKIIEISSLCGFGSLSQFNRIFRRTIGHTPSAWRARHY